MFEVVDGPEADGPVIPVYLEIGVGGKSDAKLLSDLPTDTYYVQQAVREHFAPRKSTLGVGVQEMVKFACTKVEDLGFKDLPPEYGEVWERIRTLGHSLCLPSDALVLRRALIQPVGDHLVVAMDGVVCPGGIHHVYTLDQYYESAPCLKVCLIRLNEKIHLRTKVLYRL
ncbi:MAG: hypothetical protein AAB719_00245 [Patescibacteria group bacterium]